MQKAQQSTLNLLLTMPLDVAFEIFGFLPPSDIISMAKSNKLLRQTLVSTSTIWRASRELVKGPSCPRGFSEMDWTLLLYGTRCQVSNKSFYLKINYNNEACLMQSCGVNECLEIKFPIGRRVCTLCKLTK